MNEGFFSLATEKAEKFCLESTKKICIIVQIFRLSSSNLILDKKKMFKHKIHMNFT